MYTSRKYQEIRIIVGEKLFEAEKIQNDDDQGQA